MSELAEINLQKYQISDQLGFLPAQPPLTRLPQTCYQIWEDTLDGFSSPCNYETIRQQMDTMSVLSTAALVTEPEWRRAYVVLTMMSQIYLWAGYQPSKELPRSLAVPLLEVSAHLGIEPCASFASFCLWNIRPIQALGYLDPEVYYNPENLVIIDSFTGTKDEEWFFCVSASIEAIGGRMIPKMLEAIDAARNGRRVQVTEILDEFADCLARIEATLVRMYENCAPSVFYHCVRRFLSGSKSMGGVWYEGVDGPGDRRSYAGGSNAQSSLIQLFDIVLGIDHTDESVNAACKSPSSFHCDMRGYMPGPHRDFLHLMSRAANIRPFAMGHLAGSDIRAAYNRAVGALGQIRQKHLIMTARYIIAPALKEKGKGGLEGVRGTGGTDFIPLLKEARDRTIESTSSRVCRDC
ncbi:indoleamine 2,3-dioxygenase [Aspergillus udagawae]|uniref:Indoleamine 2,3-dioxygenase n=1 Tax=Aspergillus udagawae TaxID=91492 RepID=A0A8H3NHB3_9EURO|nr:indoleamine 2,3-dioxygenase [Aspergillus udagawae]